MKIGQLGCRECGKPFTPRQPSALFCSTVCRGSFNRRRRDRGTEIYDFVMAASVGVDCNDTINALLNSYKTADKAIRDGRPSYQPIDQAVTRIPLAFSDLGDKR